MTPKRGPHSADASEDVAIDQVVSSLRLFGLESERYVHLVGVRHHMGRNEVRAIGVIRAAQSADDPVTPSALADRLGLSLSATTALVDRLVGADHVVRRQSEVDARRFELRATATADEVSRTGFAPLNDAIARVMADMNVAEVDAVQRFLDAATAAAAEASAMATGT